jgi:DNA-binding IclR family transcriptional regulator
MTVNRNPGVRPLEAAEIMLLDPSTVTRLVEKLQSKGMVTRKTQGRTFRIYYGPVRVDDHTRKQWLAGWSTRLQSIEQEKPILVGRY